VLPAALGVKVKLRFWRVPALEVSTFTEFTLLAAMGKLGSTEE
jgi:hypothetical protein